MPQGVYNKHMSLDHIEFLNAKFNKLINIWAKVLIRGEDGGNFKEIEI